MSSTSLRQNLFARFRMPDLCFAGDLLPRRSHDYRSVRTKQVTCRFQRLLLPPRPLMSSKSPRFRIGQRIRIYGGAGVGTLPNGPRRQSALTYQSFWGLCIARLRSNFTTSFLSCRPSSESSCASTRSAITRLRRKAFSPSSVMCTA
jgi:hypothetical protein